MPPFPNSSNFNASMAPPQATRVITPQTSTTTPTRSKWIPVGGVSPTMITTPSLAQNHKGPKAGGESPRVATTPDHPEATWLPRQSDGATPTYQCWCTSPHQGSQVHQPAVSRKLQCIHFTCMFPPCWRIHIRYAKISCDWCATSRCLTWPKARIINSSHVNVS